MYIWYVYILKSLKDLKTYTGYTKNLERRLKEHNNGLVKSTKNRRPLMIMYTEKFESEIEAKNRKKWYKSSSGRRKIKKIYK